MDRTLRRAALGTLAAGLVLAGLFLSPGAAFARAHALVVSPWFPALLVGLYLLRPLLAWPITALSVLVGYRYGVVVGLPVALLGAVATSLIPYGLARTFRTDRGFVGRIVGGSERYFAAAGDLRGVIAARLAPTPAEAVSGAAGMAGVSIPAFVVGTAIGELPWTIAAVTAGAALPALAGGSFAVVDPRLVPAGLLIAALLLAGPAYRHLRGRAGRAGG